MDADLTDIRPGWIFVGLWVGLFFLRAAADSADSASLPLTKLFAFLMYLLAWLAYPLVLVFASTVTNATTSVRIFVAANLAVFCVALILRPLDGSVTDRWFSAVGLIAFLGIQFGAVRALTSAERHFGLDVPGAAFGAWLSLLFFPFCGIFFIHKRHRVLVQHASAA
jgi:hypothetical protein